jgi:hypothetical protein
VRALYQSADVARNCRAVPQRRYSEIQLGRLDAVRHDENTMTAITARANKVTASGMPFAISLRSVASFYPSSF